MKKQITLVLVALFISLAFNSCNKNDSKNPLTCNLSKQTQVSEDMTITFSATQTGDGIIESLTYKVGSNENTVDNPTLPWQVDVEVSAGTEISIEANGKTTNGSLKVMMKGSTATSTIEASDYCEQQSN